MYGYIHWRMTTEISVMYGSEGVKHGYINARLVNYKCEGGGGEV